MIFIGRYNKVEHYVTDTFTYLLEEIHKLELELGHLPQKWKMLWEQLELPTTDSLTVSFKNSYFSFCYDANINLLFVYPTFRGKVHSVDKWSDLTDDCYIKDPLWRF